MRNFLLALVLALVGCEWWCPIPIPLPAPPMDDGEDSPASEPPPPAPPTDAPAPDVQVPDAALPDAMLLDSAVATFTWHRNHAALGEQTRMLSLTARCVDANGGLIFVAETRDVEGDAVNSVAEIGLSIPYAQHPRAKRCRVILRQNQQETPDPGVPNPGTGSYSIDGIDYAPPIIEGEWEVDLYPAAG